MIFRRCWGGFDLQGDGQPLLLCLHHKTTLLSGNTVLSLRSSCGLIYTLTWQRESLRKVELETQVRSPIILLLNTSASRCQQPEKLLLRGTIFNRTYDGIHKNLYI